MGAGWNAELDGLSGSGAGHLLDLGEFGAGSGEADLEAFDFAEPSFAAGLFDPGQQVLADIEKALALGWLMSAPGTRPTRSRPIRPSSSGRPASTQGTGSRSASS